MIEKIMEQKLKDSLNIESLEIINESHLHKGHSGDDGSGESHFCIHISADDFKDQSRLQSHRLIFSILEEEMKIIHALRINID